MVRCRPELLVGSLGQYLRVTPVLFDSRQGSPGEHVPCCPCPPGIGSISFGLDSRCPMSVVGIQEFHGGVFAGCSRFLCGLSV